MISIPCLVSKFDFCDGFCGFSVDGLVWTLVTMQFGIADRNLVYERILNFGIILMGFEIGYGVVSLID